MSAKVRLLMVDDEPNVLAAHRRLLGRSFDVTTCERGAEALEVMANNPEFAVVVTDMRMPEMNGVEFVQAARKNHPYTVYIMLTGNADQQTAIDAINKGQVFRFLNKPCEPELLEQTVRAGIRQYDLINTERIFLRKTLTGSVKLLIEAMSISDPQSGAATTHIRNTVQQLCEILDFQPSWQLPVASSLVLLGSIAAPDTPDKDAMSDAYLEQVAATGATLLRYIPRMSTVADMLIAQRKAGMLPLPTATQDERYWSEYGSCVLRFAVDWYRESARNGNDQVAGLQDLSARQGIYDPQLITAAEILLAQAMVQSEDTTVNTTITITAKEARPGDVLKQDVRLGDGRLLVGAGHVLTPVMVERIRGFDKAGLLNPNTLMVSRQVAAQSAEVRAEAA